MCAYAGGKAGRRQTPRCPSAVWLLPREISLVPRAGRGQRPPRSAMPPLLWRRLSLDAIAILSRMFTDVNRKFSNSEQRSHPETPRAAAHRAAVGSSTVTGGSLSGSARAICDNPAASASKTAAQARSCKPWPAPCRSPESPAYGLDLGCDHLCPISVCTFCTLIKRRMQAAVLGSGPRLAAPVVAGYASTN